MTGLAPTQAIAPPEEEYVDEPAAMSGPYPLMIVRPIRPLLAPSPDWNRNARVRLALRALAVDDCGSGYL